MQSWCKHVLTNKDEDDKAPKTIKNKSGCKFFQKVFIQRTKSESKKAAPRHGSYYLWISSDGVDHSYSRLRDSLYEFTEFGLGGEAVCNIEATS
uniref:Uncharacterized protein n=1 Tax=Romanomermis culicivorax TaxID=13658 RepID=A0A915IIP0_ROMCU